MAKVELINFTGKGREDETWHAADMLIFTKSTRLNMNADLLRSIKAMDPAEKEAELAYMATTIPSSWEFANVIFLIKDVSRACAQQITRTRTASFAMQSLRVVDASDIGVVNPFDFAEQPELYDEFESMRRQTLKCYQQLKELGAQSQDARAILPLNTHCNLTVSYNLRAFVDLIKARSSLRVQGEYVDIADQMKRAVLDVWPWAKPFFTSPNDKAIALLEDVAKELGLTPGEGHGWAIAKAIDLIRKG